jgi:hypothetical protein
VPAIGPTGVGFKPAVGAPAETTHRRTTSVQTVLARCEGREP